MSQINIRRNNSIIERYRNFTMYLDGEKLVSIKNGETLAMNIPPGKHILIAKIDWNTSNCVIFTLEEGDCIQFVVRTHGMLKSFYYAFAKPNMYLVLKEEQPTK